VEEHVNVAGDIPAVLWRRLDRAGHDAVRLERHGAGWRLTGIALVVDAGRPCRLDYEVTCDDAWRTRRTRVTGWLGAERVDITLDADGEGEWRRDGEPQPQVAGCLDVDLGFTPATNTLPIRRLTLPVGASAAVRAAWLRFPELTLEALEQVYTRTGEDTYRYESDGGRFVAPLEVSASRLVTRYGALWSAEASTGLGGDAGRPEG
jgi:hypothetical protein